MATYILPGLYLGSRRDATNEEWLKQTRFSVLVSALTRCEFRDYILPLDLDKRDVYHIDVDDDHEEVIHIHFRSVHQIIQEAIKEGKTVLVHCATDIRDCPPHVGKRMVVSGTHVQTWCLLMCKSLVRGEQTPVLLTSNIRKL